MKLIGVLFTLLALLLMFYFMGAGKKEDRINFILVCAGILMIYLTSTIVLDPLESFIPILALFIVGFSYWVLNKSKQIIRDAHKVKAKQDTYWGIDPERIKDRFAHRIVQKKGRKEIDDKYLIVDFFYSMTRQGKKVLSSKPINEISLYTPEKSLTKIKSIDYFKKDATELTRKVFNKCKDLAEEAELEFDYDEILKANNYYMEWFLIYIWERTTKDEDVGVATLNAIAENKKEIDLIGALDSSISFGVNKDGLEMLAHYYFYHGRFDEGSKE